MLFPLSCSSLKYTLRAKNTSGKKHIKYFWSKTLNRWFSFIIHSFSIIFSRYESLARNFYCCQKKKNFETILSLKVYGNLKLYTRCYINAEQIWGVNLKCWILNAKIPTINRWTNRYSMVRHSKSVLNFAPSRSCFKLTFWEIGDYKQNKRTTYEFGYFVYTIDLVRLENSNV